MNSSIDQYLPSRMNCLPSEQEARWQVVYTGTDIWALHGGSTSKASIATAIVQEDSKSQHATAEYKPCWMSCRSLLRDKLRKLQGVGFLAA